MKFTKLRCNYMENPLGVSDKITLTWNYGVDYERGITQKNAVVTVALDQNMKEIVCRVSPETGDGMRVEIADSSLFAPRTLYYWNVEAEDNSGRKFTSAVNHFEIAMVDLGGHYITTKLTPEEEPDSISFVRDFKLRMNIVKARVYVFAHGFLDLFINDVPADPDRRIVHCNTQYEKFRYYETYDITDVVAPGMNSFDFRVSSGYDRSYSRFGWRNLSNRGMAALIYVTYKDGREDIIATDENWKWRKTSLTASSMFMGETCDARLRPSMFRLGDCIINEGKADKGVYAPREVPQIKVYKTVEPLEVHEAEGGLVFDFGMNAAGVCRLSFDGAQKGQTITIAYAEMLRHDGSLSDWTNRGAEAVDTYICAGRKHEEYEALTTYHGFRYVKISGIEGLTDLKVVANYFSMASETIGHFTCSDAILNDIQENCINSLRGNIVTIPTDCDMRDERTPCLMDSMCVEEAASYNFDLTAFYRKWAAEIAKNGSENISWDGDAINVMWQLFITHGDIRLARDNFDTYLEMMEKFEKRSDNLLAYDSGCGDWCHPNRNTWDTIGGNCTSVNASLFYHFAVSLARLADVLGRPEDAAKMTDLAKRIRKEYQDRWIAEDGTAKNDRQMNYMMPVRFGLVTGEKKELTLKKLKEKLTTDGHPDVGIFGMTSFIDAPAENGMIDDVYKIIRTSVYPSLGWMLANGAKSMWEEWAYTGVMHSHNHAMYSSISASFYRILAGIKTDEPGFRKFTVKPILPTDMDFVKADVDTNSGKIESIVKRIRGTADGEYDWIDMTVRVPVNTKAKIYVPMIKVADVTVFDGETVLDKEKLTTENGYYVFENGSGYYNYRVVPTRFVYPKTRITRDEITEPTAEPLPVE